MKTKLFENIEGNKFRLLKESTLDENKTYVQSGLKKVFSNAGNNISYRQIESVGMGYIRDINSAKQFALQEAREIAESFGYKDNEEEAKFIKDSPNVRPLKKEEHGESDMSNPEENREVQIGRQIINLLQGKKGTIEDYRKQIQQAIELAEELIKMHGGK